MNFYKFILFFICMNYIFGCVEKTTYSGKLFSDRNLSKVNIANKNDLIMNFGSPSYIDEFNNQYFYYTEMNKNKNFYNKKTEYSYLFVFKLDENDKVISSQSINLLDKNTSTYNKNETMNNIVERGLIEKIFGGVGPNKLPNSP